MEEDLIAEVQRLRAELTLLFEIAQLPRATYYYHLKQMDRTNKYETEKAEITSIYYENKGRYGYRRITIALHNKGIFLNHKTVQKLIKQLGLTCHVRMKKYRSYKGEVGKIVPQQSMSHKGNCLDNAVMGNFFDLLKSELLCLQKFDSMEHFMMELVHYLDYYNKRSIKAKLKGLPPAFHRQQALSAA